MILVTGATGQFGAKAVEHLLKKGVEPSAIAVLVRNSDKGKHLEIGITVRQGDYTDHGSMVRAFTGVDKLLLVSSNNREAIENRTQHHKNAIDAAKEAGVNHLVYTSFVRKPGFEDSAIADFQNSHLETEKHLIESGMDYTILQNGIYAEMILAFSGDKIAETKNILFPAGEGKASWVLREELAEAAAHVLITNGHENKSYTLTNSEAVGFDFIAEQIAEILGEKIAYKSPSSNEFKVMLQNAKVPEMYIDMLTMWATALKQLTMDKADDTLASFLKREPTAVSKYLADHFSNRK